MSYLATADGQTYSILVGSGWQQDQAATIATPTAESKKTIVTTSQALTRIAQTENSQYLTQSQHDQWYASACSATALTMIIDAYGHDYRLGNILAVEIAIGAIMPSQGLLSPSGIDQTAMRFGFQTQTLSHPTLDQLLQTANDGTPILINFPPQPGTIWAGGHFLVLLVGDPSAIHLADSSTINLQVVDASYLNRYWRGFAKILTPVS